MLNASKNCLRLLAVLRRRQFSGSASTVNSKRVKDIRLAYKVSHTKAIIERANSLYQPDQLMLCFNGGKDCTVLLDLLSKQRNETQKPLQTICVNSFEPFEEVEKFIDKCKQSYYIDLKRYNGGLKFAVEQAIEDFPQVRAVFMGTRQSDPGCAHLTELTPCTRDWPPLMRVFPLLMWNYHDVWHYLLSENLPYCSLYDQGYTSLGDRSDTRLNPNLLFFDERLDKLVYKPAYELRNEKLERSNREDATVQFKRQTSYGS